MLLKGFVFHASSQTTTNIREASALMCAARGEVVPASESFVADASASNVAGYLYNASRRLRVPAADGGRGTRRRVEIVSSAAVKTLLQGDGVVKDAPDEKKLLDVVVDDDGEEWDVVVPLSAKLEAAAAVKQQEDLAEDEKGAKKIRLEGSSSAKAEAGRDDVTGYLNDDIPEPLIAGSRPPLTSMPRRFTADPTEIARQEQEKAEKKSQKIVKMCANISRLLAMIARGRCLYRASMHPIILKGLLRMEFGVVDVVGSKRLREASGAPNKSPNLFAIAVREASELYKQACDRCSSGETLAACWVTLKKDGAGNFTSKAVMQLLRAINDRFVLQRAQTVAKDDDREDNRGVDGDWCLSEVPMFVIRRMLRQCLSHSEAGKQWRNTKYPLPSPVHFCVIFLSLSRLVGMQTKIVVCDRVQANLAQTGAQAGAAKIPASWCWAEVWCPLRQCVLSVNPCGGSTTVWNSPHCISIGGDSMIDSTPRYVSKFSAVFPNRVDNLFGPATEHYLWLIKPKFGKSMTVLDVITEPFCGKATKTSQHILQRERKQLERLLYSEPVPTTITTLKQHPLYTLESAVARHEGVYPKDATTIVGQVKGHCVYKRSAVVSLRSETGWLRENRQVRVGEVPYKVVPPPPSRPLASPSRFFGLWQTEPFCPAEAPAGQPIPMLLNTNWYILLRCQPPVTLCHLEEPGVARIARRMNIEFAQAVVGYERKQIARNRRGTWETVLSGIVVRASDADAVRRAYEEYMQLQKEQEDARRRLRALKWWKAFAQRLLAMDRLQSQFLEGLRR